jgi:uncharacterized protein (TIGR02466 family)
MAGRVLTNFAAPLVEHRHPAPQLLNQELKALFLAREVQGATYRNPVPTPTVQVAIFESAFDLLSWPERCIQELKSFCFEALLDTVCQLSGYDAATRAKLEIHDDTWFHITRQGGYIAAHNHPNASWSFVYCVAAGEQPADKPDSGLLRFIDPRPHCVMYMDMGNAHLKAPYGQGSTAFRLVPGQLVLFPSYLMHEVAPFFGRDERITVASNTTIRMRKQ